MGPVEGHSTDTRTAQARSEEQLAVLEHLYETAPIGLAYMSTDLRFVRINERMATINGCSIADHLGRTLREVIPEIADRVEPVYRRVIETRRPALDFEVRGTTPARPGEERVWLASYHPVKARDGSVLGVSTVVQDITERVRAEEALQHSERRLAEAQQVARLGHWDWDIPADRLAWSEEIHRLFGLPEEEFGATYEAFLECVHPDDRPMVMRAVDEAVNRRRPYSIEHRIIRPDGTHCIVHERGEVTYDESGAPRRMLGTVHDITERVRLEEQLRQSQKMEALGQLSGGIAHDFNNLLTVISGYAEILLAEGRGTDGESRELREIVIAARRAGTLTRQLLTFSRQQMVQPRVLSVNNVVADMTSMLRRLIGENIELFTRLDPSLRMVEADSGQIEQIVVNLAINARDAMPDGGSLTIETANLEWSEADARTYGGLEPGAYVLLSIVDVGCGMTGAVKRRIFEPFFTTKEPGRGTGLGLSTVYGIVEQSGGHIDVTSEVGAGTTFRICLPVSERQPLAPREEAARPATGAETILLVEDAESIRRLTQRLLEDAGYSVLVSASAEEAIEAFRTASERVLLAITDVVLPDRNGRELAERLKSEQPDLQILFVSGYTARAFDQLGQPTAGMHFMPKPFTRAQLLGKVREILDGKPG